MRSTPKSGRSKSVSQLIATVQSWLVGLLPALNSKYSAMILKWEPLETLCMPSRDRRYPKLRWAVVVLSLWVAYSMWPWFHEQVVRRVYVTVKPCLPPVDPIVEKEFWHGNFGPGRTDITPQMVTVVIATFETSGFRPNWVNSIVETYVSHQYKHLIDQVIIVWNNPDQPHPEFPGAKVLVMTENSLNNRWIAPVEHAKTDAIMVLDNDLMVDINGISCMLSWWQKYPDRIIGPYARHINENKLYFAKDMFFSKAEYKVVLPRAMMLHRTLMAHYSNATQVTKDYVTRTHCDDMVMNAVASYHTGKPPLRVQLPPESIIDYFELCRRTRRDLTGGVSLKPGWKNNRGQCAYFVQTQYNFPYKTTDEVGVCNSANTHFKPQCRVEARRWTRMFSGSGCNTG